MQNLQGREQVLGWLGAYWEAFPDASLEIVRTVEAGDRMAAEGKMTATHTGMLKTPNGDLPPTGRSVEVRWMAMYEVAGDELKSEHLYFDPTDVMTHLGLAPGAPAQAAAAE